MFKRLFYMLVCIVDVRIAQMSFMRLSAVRVYNNFVTSRCKKMIYRVHLKKMYVAGNESMSMVKNFP